MKVIVTGVTGMVGEGVMHECLQHPEISEVLAFSRKPTGVSHPKLKELIHENFFNVSAIAGQLSGFDACFFCLGVTSIGKNETEYTHLTYDLTLHVAQVMAQENPAMTFCYISGASTDSSEKGRVMWARVKGRTENALMRLPFRNVFLFRPGYMQPTKGLKHTLSFYKYVSWLYPLMKRIFPNSTSTLKELALAMINSARKGYPKHVLEVKDIKILAKSD